MAVIGVSCRFPGAADLDAFAAMLAQGVDAVTEIPPERFTREAYLHSDPKQAGKTYTLAAGVIEGVDRFDAAFFGISPREAEQMDPQQRLLLELTHEALEDAGMPATRLAGTRTGVYVGGSASDYLALRLGDPAVANAYFMTGATLSTLSNRISYVFDLKGPSFTVDTACSSSLVALHLACMAMRRGDVDMAIVGGVNLLLSPQSYVGFSRASMLSPRGRCHAFAAGADGYVRAEGGGVVLIKPLDVALADGDDIRFVIEATGVNSDGRTAGLSLPSRTAQAALLRDVYGNSRVDPDDLVYVEAHGTGTAVGDPIEAGALGEVLGHSRTRPLPIGSVKTNIGHLEAGSGMAGLLKAMIVLRDGVIPASLHCEVPNPTIDFAALNLSLTRESTPVLMAREKRGGGDGLSRPAAAVNSFGFGGTNAHTVISAAPLKIAEAEIAGSEVVRAEVALPPLLVSARSDAALAQLVEAWRDRLAGLSECQAAPLLRGAARRREHHPNRLAATGGTVTAIVEALASRSAGQDRPDLSSGSALGRSAIAFVYSGNGSQWAGMGLDGLGNPDFRAAIEEADAELSPLMGWRIVDQLRTADAAALRRTAIAQPLLFAIQYATTRTLACAGIRAAGTLGHSVGEVAAAAAAGVLSLPDAALVIAARSAAQQKTEHQGGMAVLGLGPDEALGLLDRVPEVEIAAVNSRGSITVAGPRAALQRLQQLAARRRVHYAALDLDYAFHSAAMDPIRDGLLTDLKGLQPARAAAPFYSTVYGASNDGTGLGAEYWWQNVRAPVRFAKAMSAAIEDGCNILLEIGPNPVLQSYMRDALKQADVPGRVLSTLSRRLQAEDPFRRIAGQVYVAGHDISGAALFDGAASTAALPRYPWQRERFWYEATDEATDTIAARRDHPLLGFRRGSEPALWFNTLDTVAEPWLADHALDGTPLLPATAMVEIALAAARARHPEAAHLDVLDLEISRPLILEADSIRETRFSVSGERGAFELASRPRLSGEAWTVHATGRIAAGSPAALPMPPALDEGETSLLSGDALHALTTRLGLQYGPAFRTVREVVVQGDRAATVALMGALPVRGAGYLMDPARLDGALQGLVALAAGHVGGGAALLPWRFGRVRLALPAGELPEIEAAVLRISRVGPRSVLADVTLLDAAGAPVALFGDCWFTRVGGGTVDAMADALFHTVEMPSPRGAAALPTPRPVFVEASDAEDEAGLLTEAFVATVAHEAVAAVAGLQSNRTASLVAQGRVHAEAVPLLEALLGWLERDGLLERDGETWTLADDGELPPAAEIWRSILASAPQAVAEAALVGAMAEALPGMLSAGPVAGRPGGLTALIAHLVAASPAARSAIGAAADAAGQVAAAWPVDRPLRVLELGAFDAAVTAPLAAALRRSGATVLFTASLAPGADRTAIGAALAGLPQCGVVEAGAELRGFDLVVGFAAHARAGVGGPRPDMLAPGGLLLMVEPRPNRVWDMCFGAAASWWREDGTGSPLQDGAGWSRSLVAAGFHDPVAMRVAGAVWDTSLVMAQALRAGAVAVPAVAVEAGLLILANPGDAAADALADAMLAGGRRSLTAPLESAAETLRSAPPLDGDVVLMLDATPDTLAEAGALLAACTTALAESSGLRLHVVTRSDRPCAAALRGITRVMANEAPNLRTHFLSIAADLAADAAAAGIAAELSAPDGETEVTLGAAVRRVPRLRRGLGADPVSTAPARLVVGRAGLLDTLRWERMSPAAPGPGQVAITVAASGLNFRDVMWALGLLPDEALMGGLAGATLGLECAGTVTAVGPGVSGINVGDRVSAIAPASLATHVLAPAQAVVRLPDHVDFAAGATVPVAFLTVCYALGTLANLQPGERVLIHGGAGGVGLAAIQYARHRGAEIFASAGSPAKRAVLRLLGVDHVLDSRSLAFADDVMAATARQGVDVVLNSLAGEAMERSVGVLRPFGRFLELGKRDLYGNTPLGLRALRHNVSYFAIDADQLPVQRPDVARRVFAEIQDLMAQGALRPVPHRLFGFGAAVDAFRLMQSAGHIGKIVLAPEPEGVELPVVTDWSPGREGTYVVTGGLAGFGLETARWFATKGVRSLALLSRRGAATPGADAVLEALAGEGVMVRAFACDVADEAALDATLEEIRAEMLPIIGVVHAAMVLDDALLPQLNAARFARVLQPKLNGAIGLDRLTRGDPIETFLIYSSITTTIGNPGQANYVAANAGMEALVAARLAAGLPGLSVGWGPIADVGYLSREQAVSEALASRMGAAHLRSDEALALLPRLLTAGIAHVDVAHMKWATLRQHLPHLSSPLFADVRGQQDAEAGEADLARLLLESSPEEARALMGQILADEVAAITKTPAGRIDLNRSLTDLGMDSLMAVELRMALERRFGANLPLLSLADGASIGAIAARIVRQMTGALPEAASVAAAMLVKYEDSVGDDDLSEPGALVVNPGITLEASVGDD